MGKERETLIDFLNARLSAGRSTPRVSFHMPGHKGRAAIYEAAGYKDFARNIIGCDITEIPGADALYCPETVIRAVMENYAVQYGALRSELLVNGSSAGVMAALMASVPLGGTLILGRNSHHSAFSAMRLGAINPVYIEPDRDPSTGLTSGISAEAVEEACSAHPNASSIFITSPNYYGALSDISGIADIARSYGMLLIVDQAHGAHLKFFDNEGESRRAEGGFIPYPRHSAESLGADIVINSTHKTLLSFTGSGILNICSGRADEERITDMLRMLQTTSPSYILMASLDINERIMRTNGPAIIRSWQEDLIYFYRHAANIDGISLICPDPGGIRNDTGYPMYDRPAGFDVTKINIGMPELGLTGAALEKLLRRCGIDAEMVHGDYVMLMSGAGSSRTDYTELLTALKEISSDHSIIGSGRSSRRNEDTGASYILSELPQAAEIPLESESVPLYESDGRVLYDPVIIYPPGSPLVCPGEIMSLEAISLISRAIEDGEKVTGVTDEGLVRVGREL